MPKPHQFGKPVGTLKQLKSRLKKSSGGGFMTYVPKEGITVRFLTEPMEFVEYEECWDNGTNKSFPYMDWMEEGKDYSRKSRVFLANALDIEKDRVIAFQVKVSVMNKLVNKLDKYDTITDADYEISKYGSGKDTEYEIEREGTKKRNLDTYTPLDLEDVIRQAYEAVHGDEQDGDDEEDERPSRSKSSTTPSKRRKMTRGEPDDVDEPAIRRKKKSSSSTSKSTKARRTSRDYDPDEQPF